MKKNKGNYQKVYRNATLALLCSFICPYILYAQNDTSKKLKQVNISSSRAPVISIVTPAQQITATDFTRYSALNVADAIQDFAGVNIKDYGGIGGLKTVSVRSLGADHLAVLYDGVSVNDEQNGQIDLGKFNLNNVQEIILYNGQPPQICMPARSFAYANVLAIKTVRPYLTVSKPYQVLLGVKGGSFGLINPYLQWQQRISDKWSFIINSYWEKANGQYNYHVKGQGADTTLKRTNADVNTQEADGALYWAKNDSNKFNLHLNYYNSDRGLPGAVIFYNPISNQRIWNRDIFTQAGYERIWQSSLHLLLNTKLSQEHTRYIDPDYLNDRGGLDYRYTQREAYQSVALSYNLLKNWEVSYSADVSYSDLSATNGASADPGANPYQGGSPQRFTLLNVIASDLTIGKWLFEGSLLNTYIDERLKGGNAIPSKFIFSPTLIGNFQPFDSPDFKLRAFYKNIFRFPTFDEQYFFAVNTTRNIKPEYVKQYDLGIIYNKQLNSFLDYFTLTADGYYNNVKDKIIALPNQNPVISSFINLGRVNIKGIDIGIKTKTRDINGYRGSLSVSYTYQHAIDSASNLQIPYTPSSAFAVNTGIDRQHWGIYYNQVFSSSRYYLNSPDSPVDGYSVSDLSFLYRLSISSKTAVFSAHIDNLFNSNYAIVRSFPMPGRSLLLSFQITI